MLAIDKNSSSFTLISYFSFTRTHCNKHVDRSIYVAYQVHGGVEGEEEAFGQWHIYS